MTVQDKYEVEVNYELDQLSKIELGSEEHRRGSGDITQLTDRYIRLKEVENEERRIAIEEAKAEAEKEKAELEQQRIALELQRIEDEKQDRKIKRWFDVGIAVTKVVALGGITVVLLGFEKNGTLVISNPGRKIVDYIYRMV